MQLGGSLPGDQALVPAKAEEAGFDEEIYHVKREGGGVVLRREGRRGG